MGTKWTSKQRKRFIATMTAKRKAKANGSNIKHDASKTVLGTNYHDAVIYLRYAEREIGKQISSGMIKKLDSTQLYTLLALNALQGK